MSDRAGLPYPPRGLCRDDDLLAECLAIAAIIHADDLKLGRPVRALQTAGILRDWIKHRREKPSTTE